VEAVRLSVQVKGIDTLSLRTKALIAAAERGMKSGVAEGGQILVDEAQVFVPVLTGNLRDHIHAELVEATDTRATINVLPAFTDPNPYGLDPEYARRVHDGFIGTDSLGRHYHQAGQPFMNQAWDSKKDEVQQAIKDHLIEEVDAVISR
jgi:hypothetical protein